MINDAKNKWVVGENLTNHFLFYDLLFKFSFCWRFLSVNGTSWVCFFRCLAKVRIRWKVCQSHPSHVIIPPLLLQIDFGDDRGGIKGQRWNSLNYHLKLGTLTIKKRENVGIFPKSRTQVWNQESGASINWGTWKRQKRQAMTKLLEILLNGGTATSFRNTSEVNE